MRETRGKDIPNHVNGTRHPSRNSKPETQNFHETPGVNWYHKGAAKERIASLCEPNMEHYSSRKIKSFSFPVLPRARSVSKTASFIPEEPQQGNDLQQ